MSTAHRFFSAGFEPLHAHVVDLLAEDGVHSLLPFLGVNREWRNLAVKRMLKVYEGTLERMQQRSSLTCVPKEEEGECLPVFIGRRCHDGPDERDDPRSNIARARVAGFESLDIGALFFSSFDPSTMLCSFKPWAPSDGVLYQLYCNEERNEWPDVIARFCFRPTGWFRRAQPGAQAARHGLELAARPDRHPPCLDYLLHPKEPPKPPRFLLEPEDDNVEDKQSKVFEERRTVDFCSSKSKSSWTASYTAERFDWLTAPEDIVRGRFDVPARLTVHEVKVLFINLFVPFESLVRPEYERRWSF